MKRIVIVASVLVLNIVGAVVMAHAQDGGDWDADSIPDDTDQCPYLYGFGELDGCPHLITPTVLAGPTGFTVSSEDGTEFAYQSYVYILDTAITANQMTVDVALPDGVNLVGSTLSPTERTSCSPDVQVITSIPIEITTYVLVNVIEQPEAVYFDSVVAPTIPTYIPNTPLLVPVGSTPSTDHSPCLTGFEPAASHAI